MPWKLADTSKSTPAYSSPSPVCPHSFPAHPAALIFPMISSEAATSSRHARKADTTKPLYLTFKAMLPVGSYQTQLLWECQQKQSEATTLPGLQIYLILFSNSHFPGWSFKHFWRFIHSPNRNSSSSHSWATIESPVLLWNLSFCTEVSKLEGLDQHLWDKHCSQLHFI